MLVPVDNIIDGSWVDDGVTPPPQEWNDFQLMRAMNWSWEQLQETPAYVRRYCVDFLILEAEERAKQIDSQRRAHG